MTRLREFSPINPTGTAPGIEPLRLDVIKAAVNNEPPAPLPTPTVATPVAEAAPVATPVQLVGKNLRLPADLVEFIDYVYTKDKRIKKQDAYTRALEAFFRPLMKA